MPDEDVQLRNLVEKLGPKGWDEIARYMPQRTARQCRDRYKNYLLENLVTDPWTPEEDAIVVQQFHQIGPKWVRIGKMLSGRSGNNVKNRWHKHLCRLERTTTENSAGHEQQGAANEPPRSDLELLEWLGSLDHPFGSEFSFEDSLF
jgi:hypothetical protein